MILDMARQRMKELVRWIKRGREKAGTLNKLLDALGEPRLPKRTVEKWAMEESVPAVDRAEALIERIKKYLGEP